MDDAVNDLLSWRARIREVRELHEIFRQDDGKLIGAYMAGTADTHFIAYATHKAAINALDSAEAVASYDITTGWPV